ncbi:MAG: ribosome maturation factor RimP [Candidatus Cloacimonadales bacterium]|jgi:ribosome maturation factor RimP|nr:ribosome maturation factor RimP [Candidatus Cloacimonadota bacterium]MDD2650120.1 ribosome maturation factor RimP [Candidatus Cloacimonadota bacterium]MDD3501250.1 ribosome maturation factor RimP [Candidatus Cloacimonadota bacterium]MDX9977319.1 ribosome maturation factor RimP [Candidatus Cloacimonadales bacterium]
MIERIEPAIKKACANNGVGLYDIEVKKTAKGLVICVFITKVGGVSVDDCINVNRSISVDFDADEPISSRYFLEVSSPGLERPLKFKKHYISAINELIRVTFIIDEKSQTVEGTLLEVEQDSITVDTEKEEFVIPFNSIKKARTVYRFGKKEKS